MILNQRITFQINLNILFFKDTFPFGGVDFVFDFVAAIYIKSANSLPIKLPIATPIPPILTPQYTLLLSCFTIGFFCKPTPMVPLQRCAILKEVSGKITFLKHLPNVAESIW